jgi:transcriptional regulator with XRE-family HTH domain
MIEEAPRHIGQRISDGEGPIQVWREHRCIPITALAKKVGLSPAAMMELEIEGQGADGALLTDIAAVLGVPVEYLTNPGGGSDGNPVTGYEQVRET